MPGRIDPADMVRTIEIQAGDQVITTADPLPDNPRAALKKIGSARRAAHQL